MFAHKKVPSQLTSQATTRAHTVSFVQVMLMRTAPRAFRGPLRRERTLPRLAGGDRVLRPS
eukprot:151237-Pleurochrysis_carterae.AAC.1